MHAPVTITLFAIAALADAGPVFQRRASHDSSIYEPHIRDDNAALEGPFAGRRRASEPIPDIQARQDNDLAALSDNPMLIKISNRSPSFGKYFGFHSGLARREDGSGAGIFQPALTSGDGEIQMPSEPSNGAIRRSLDSIGLEIDPMKIEAQAAKRQYGTEAYPYVLRYDAIAERAEIPQHDEGSVRRQLDRGMALEIDPMQIKANQEYNTQPFVERQEQGVSEMIPQPSSQIQPMARRQWYVRFEDDIAPISRREVMPGPAAPHPTEPARLENAVAARQDNGNSVVVEGGGADSGNSVVVEGGGGSDSGSSVGVEGSGGSDGGSSSAVEGGGGDSGSSVFYAVAVQTEPARVMNAVAEEGSEVFIEDPPIETGSAMKARQNQGGADSGVQGGNGGSSMTEVIEARETPSPLVLVEGRQNQGGAGQGVQIESDGGSHLTLSGIAARNTPPPTIVDIEARQAMVDPALEPEDGGNTITNGDDSVTFGSKVSNAPTDDSNNQDLVNMDVVTIMSRQDTPAVAVSAPLFETPSQPEEDSPQATSVSARQDTPTAPSSSEAPSQEDQETFGAIYNAIESASSHPQARRKAAAAASRSLSQLHPRGVTIPGAGEKWTIKFRKSSDSSNNKARQNDAQRTGASEPVGEGMYVYPELDTLEASFRREAKKAARSIRTRQLHRSKRSAFSLIQGVA